jgi:putative endonuclease
VTRSRTRLGNSGERFAARQLEADGWRILETNWRCDQGEIDIVAEDGTFVVFAEVRTRRGEQSGRAEESITPAKAARLLGLAERYIDEHPGLSERYWRVDLIAITLDQRGNIVRYSHIQDAVLEA